jgi:hypothetical protein
VRLWSIHPRYLDAPGLTALWREGLLARKVLRGETVGYRHHPQLERFRAHRDPSAAIDAYLSCVLDEAEARGYHFDAGKIHRRRPCRLTISRGQLALEWRLLRGRLAVRDPARCARLRGTPDPHPCFRSVPGPIASWERARPH